MTDQTPGPIGSEIPSPTYRPDPDVIQAVELTRAGNTVLRIARFERLTRRTISGEGVGAYVVLAPREREELLNDLLDHQHRKQSGQPAPDVDSTRDSDGLDGFVLNDYNDLVHLKCGEGVAEVDDDASLGHMLALAQEHECPPADPIPEVWTVQETVCPQCKQREAISTSAPAPREVLAVITQDSDRERIPAGFKRGDWRDIIGAVDVARATGSRAGRAVCLERTYEAVRRSPGADIWDVYLT